MTWFYLPPEATPSTPSPSALASEASNSDCSLPTIIGDRLCAASATWRGKSEQPQAWSRRWKRGGFIRRLSGLTLEPSTADRFADAWISSLRAIRAKAIPWPESGAANSTTAGCSIAPSTSSIKAGLQPSSARTCRGTPTDNSPLPSRHWSDWAAALRSEYSARPKPAIPCGGSDCSSSRDGWAAPQARDHFPAHSEGYIASKKAEGHGMRNLNDEAAHWMAPRTVMGAYTRDQGDPTKERPTLEGQAQEWLAPNVPNGGRSTKHAEKVGNTMYHKGKKVQMGLESQASNWAGPKASDAEKAGPNMRGSNSDVPLPAQAMQWLAPLVADAGEKITLASHQGSLLKQANDFLPPSSPDQPIIAGGSTSSTDSPNSNQPSVKRKLNPIFVEALMRWPTGLSGFERLEMASILWLRLMPSYVSMLFSALPHDTQMEMFAERLSA